MTAETSSAASAAPVDKAPDTIAAAEAAKTANEAKAAAAAPRESAKASSSEGAPSSDKADDAQEAVLLPDKVELPARSAKPAQSAELSKAPQDENTRRKREREGSVEPTASQSGPSTPNPIPAKKNRLVATQEESSGPTAAATGAPEAGADATEGDGPGVGQIRKRVEDLDWQERKRQSVEEGARPDAKDLVKEAPQQGATKAAEPAAASTAAQAAASAPAAKPAQPTFASFSSKSSGFGSAPAAAATGASSSSTQPTFASFSGSQSGSPFVTGASGSRSWLSTAPAGSSGGLKPSALGSGLGSHAPAAAASNAQTSSSSSSSASSSHPSASSGSSQQPAAGAAASASAAKGKAAAGGGLGFGAFASGGGFGAAAQAKKEASPAPEAKEASAAEAPASKNDAAAAAAPAPAAPAVAEADSIFAQQLAAEGGDSLEKNDKPKLEANAEHLKTGEEDERTVFSARAKLYTTSDAGWKERGTGTLRCNVPRGRSEEGGRLVMRADGVLRVILNVKLFAGMSCQVAQDRFAKLVALEDGKPVHFAIKFGNPNAAHSFCEAVAENSPEK